MTVPETPSPEVLMQQQAVVGTTRRGGPGRHVSDTTPSKGRLAKTQRMDDGGMGGEQVTRQSRQFKSDVLCPAVLCIIRLYVLLWLQSRVNSQQSAGPCCRWCAV